MKLIDKDAVLAIIKNRIRACGNCYILDELTSLYHTFDSIEVKEVDWCKEEERIWKYFNMGERHLSKNDLEKISKYFFELGLKAQKGE